MSTDLPKDLPYEVRSGDRDLAQTWIERSLALEAGGMARKDMVELMAHMIAGYVAEHQKAITDLANAVTKLAVEQDHLKGKLDQSKSLAGDLLTLSLDKDRKLKQLSADNLELIRHNEELQLRPIPTDRST